MSDPQLPGGLGRRFAPDARDRQYPMRMLLRPTGLPKQRYYPLGPKLPLDQGETGTCVAHAWTAFEYAAPLMCKDADNPFDLYREIVKVDEWAENDYEATAPDDQLQQGTSVRAGVKVLQTKGRIKSYVWAHNADEAATWLLTRGTIAFGTDWYYRMSDLTHDGYAVPEGRIAGGHAYLGIGYSRTRKAFRCLTSWGKSFGQDGRFWIHHMDMDKLIAADGEACAALEQVVKPIETANGNS